MARATRKFNIHYVYVKHFMGRIRIRGKTLLSFLKLAWRGTGARLINFMPSLFVSPSPLIIIPKVTVIDFVIHVVLKVVRSQRLLRIIAGYGMVA